MKKLVRRVGWIGVLVAMVLAAGLLLIRFPEPLFDYSREERNLAVYADRPFSPEAGRKLLASIQSRLLLSPLYSKTDSHAILICNSAWRRRLFFWPNLQAGGLNYAPFSSKVFLIGADVEGNRLINSSGKPDILARGLDHFATHEITHTLTCRAVGFSKFRQLPDWVKEGYAEYVARGRSFYYDHSLAAFLANAPEMSQPTLAPYRRYELLIAFLLDRKAWTVERLLEEPPDQRQVEEMLRQESTPPRDRSSTMDPRSVDPVGMGSGGLSELGA